MLWLDIRYSTNRPTIAFISQVDERLDEKVDVWGVGATICIYIYIYGEIIMFVPIISYKVLLITIRAQ